MQNVAYINLKQLVSNAKEIKKHLKKDTKFCAVVKADGYGHGGVEVANAIYALVDSYAVCLVEEGIALRLSGIDKEILVFSPIMEEDILPSLEYDLSLTVVSKKSLITLNKMAKKQNKVAKVHIKYDTGMNRQGVRSILELKEMLNLLSKLKNVKLVGFYSHFACPNDKKEREKALSKFLLANRLVKMYNNKVISHISASGGLLKGVQLDMVRIGILLYGYKPFNSQKIKVKPIMNIFAYTLGNFTAKKGEGVLYGNIKLKTKTNYFLIRYGYADGLDRIKAKRDLNNRCMDVSACKGKCKGKTYAVMTNAEILAKKYHTISYEILTKATIRAKKIYLR